MPKISHACVIALLSCAASTAVAASRPPWPSTLPVYDHIVIVVEENKDFEQILGGKFDAPYIRKLAAEGAIFERMFAEEHYSQGNYSWLLSGSNQNVGFRDQVPSKANHPDYPFKASNLGEQLIAKGLSFKGYSESLPGIGSTVEFDPPNCRGDQCIYARKPEIFAEVQPAVTRYSESHRHSLRRSTYQARLICRGQSHYTREHPAHDRSDVWAAQVERATAQCGGRRHRR